MANTKVFVDGEKSAIQTDCDNEQEFLNEFVTMLSGLIQRQSYKGDEWVAVLRKWLPSFVNICCSYRGYKSDVDRAVVLRSGDRVVGEGVTIHEFKRPES